MIFSTSRCQIYNYAAHTEKYIERVPERSGLYRVQEAAAADPRRHGKVVFRGTTAAIHLECHRQAPTGRSNRRATSFNVRCYGIARLRERSFAEHDKSRFMY